MASLIYVAALTYKRPLMLPRLLEAWSTLRLPEYADVQFLIIDNDPAKSARPIVESFAPRFEGRLEYLVEPEPGIPNARNRALRAARDAGSDLLCFNDDDGYPARNWLVELTRFQLATRVNLAFGPQRLSLPEQPISFWQRMVAAALVARASFIERHARKECRSNRIATSGTYNWMCDINWLSKKEIWFDQSRSISGGSDTFFRETVSRAGGLLGWCPDAIVYERLQPERLSIRYQFRRAISHGITSYHSGRKAFPNILRYPLARMALGMGLIVIPVFGKASFILGVQMIGMAVGIMKARRGVDSDFYTRSD